MKLIIAQHNENVSWSDGYDRFIVKKGEHLPNIGREPLSYMWYIINFYDELDGMYIFTQANPFAHCKDFKEFIDGNPKSFTWVSDLSDLVCDNYGSPHDSNLEIDKFLTNCGLEPKDMYTFNAGCLFSISAEEIKRKPKEYYEKVFEALTLTCLSVCSMS